jgi:hypothetical protein
METHRYDHITAIILAVLSITLIQVNIILSCIALLITIAFNLEKYIAFRKRKKLRDETSRNNKQLP